MEFFYKNALLPNNKRVLKDINRTAARLYEKLNHLDVNLLDISDYNKRYLSNYLNNIRSTLQKYSYILSWSVAYIHVPLEQFVFTEYGGGSGILSLLAKELGIGTVIYNDIYDVSCRDARIIAQTVQNEADYYVHGDIDALINFLKTNSISCHAIASYDVIEHIYDIENFLIKLSDLSDLPFNVVMASGANALNPRIRKKLMQQHIEIEYKDREKKWGHKGRDCLRAYFSVRKEIISHYAPTTLSNVEIESLAKVTRGLIESEIRQCVEEYLKTGKISREEPDHPTNTCDPYTGNWAEHLMDVNYLREVLVTKGFKVNILGGYCGSSNNIINEIRGILKNFLISMLKEKGLIFAPFYTIYARKIESSCTVP